MHKSLLSVMIALSFLGCQKAHYVEYVPNISRANNPIATIKETIESQPPAQGYKPVAVEVTDKYIKLFSMQSGGIGLGFVAGRVAAVPKQDQLVQNTIYYKHISQVLLVHNKRYDQ